MMKLKTLINLSIASGLALASSASAALVQIDLNNTNVAGGDWNTIDPNVTNLALTHSGVGNAFDSAKITTAGWNTSSSSLGQAGAFVGTFGDAAQDYFWLASGATGTVTISGLSAGNYTFELVSSRSTSGTRIGDFTVGGVFADTTPNGNNFNANADGYVNGDLLVWDSVAATSGSIVISVTGDGGSAFLNAITITEAVPEPSSTALLGLGGLALIMRRRR